MKIKLIIKFAIAFCIAAFAPISNAQELSPFQAPLLGYGEFDDAIIKSKAECSQVTVVNPVDLIAFTAQIKTLGNVTLVFNREWHVPNVSYNDNGFAQLPQKQDTMHLQGFLIYRGLDANGVRSKIKVPLAATVYKIGGDTPLFEATFSADTKGRGGHFYKLSGHLIDGGVTPLSLRMRRVSRQAFSGRTCGLSLGKGQQAVLESVLAKVSAVSSTSIKSFDIATEADFDWFARYGSNSNSKIQSILNQVQTIYENQLNLTFSVTKQVVVSTSGARYNSSNVDTLLESFLSYNESNSSNLGSADLYHLFTGKDTFIESGGSRNYSVIGLAYLGVVCAFPEFSYGLTEDLDDALNHVTTAHEIGHNFNAEHDSAGSIMGTVLNLNSPPTSFSTNSRSVIATHVSRFSSCLSDGSASPTPTPASTPSNGCGSNPGEDVTDGLSLLPKLTTSGILCLSVELANTDVSCTVEIKASTNSGQVFNGTLLNSFTAGSSSTSFKDIQIKRSAVKASRPQRVFVGAVKNCGGTLSYSPVKALKPYNVKSKKKALTTSAWLRLMARLVAAASPQNP
jgi:Metallo-peptidase family M12B Reprolysin-like